MSGVEECSELSKIKERGYKAVRESGLLTTNAWTNARIWRAVEAALGAALVEEKQR